MVKVSGGKMKKPKVPHLSKEGKKFMKACRDFYDGANLLPEDANLLGENLKGHEGIFGVLRNFVKDLIGKHIGRP